MASKPSVLRHLMLAFGALMLVGMLAACDDAPNGAGDMGTPPPATPTQ